jgi:hypothetical protein
MASSSSSSIAAAGRQASSSGSSSSLEEFSAGNGSSSSGINGRAAAVAVVAAADVGSDAASGSQQQQRQPLFRPLRRPTESESPAEHGGSTAAAQQQQQETEQLQQEQDAAQQASAAADASSPAEDTAAATHGSSINGAYQQQLEAELSYEEDEQQQQRFLRQQQRQLPSLLEDAAAGYTLCYVLIPIGSSSGNGASFAAASSLLANRLGQSLQQLEVPCLGPLLLTNAPQVFRSADVLVDAPGEHYERLALTLELVKQTGSREAILQARNLSRVVRGQLDSATIRINNGQTLLRAHRAAVELIDGDVIELGDTGVAFVVQRQQQPAASPAAQAVEQFCGVYAQQQLGLQLDVQESLQALQQAQQQQQLQHVASASATQASLQQQQVGVAAASTAAGWNAAAADAIESQLRNISRLVRSNARAAEVELCQLAAAHPEAPGPWFLWAQLAASSRRHWMARALFRAAAVCQQQQLEQLSRAGPAAAEAAAAVQPLLQPDAGEDAEGTAAATAATEDPAISSSSSSILQPLSQQLLSNAGGGSKAMRRKADGIRNAASRSPAFRLSSRLVQVLRVWARSEWEQRLFGPARRLWRLAANEAFKFPYDIAAEGGGAVLHAWATAEFERDNVLNARVVIGEALRKCPKDAAVSGVLKVSNAALPELG